MHFRESALAEFCWHFTQLSLWEAAGVAAELYGQLLHFVVVTLLASVTFMGCQPNCV
jgi:hypothetical protein